MEICNPGPSRTGWLGLRVGGGQGRSDPWRPLLGGTAVKPPGVRKVWCTFALRDIDGTPWWAEGQGFLVARESALPAENFFFFNQPYLSWFLGRIRWCGIIKSLSPGTNSWRGLPGDPGCWSLWGRGRDSTQGPGPVAGALQTQGRTDRKP